MELDLVTLKLTEKSKDNFNSEQYKKMSEIIQSANLIMLTLGMVELTVSRGSDGRLDDYPGGREAFEREVKVFRSKDKIKILELAIEHGLPEDSSSLPLPRKALVAIGAMAMAGDVELEIDSGSDSGTSIEDIL